MLFSLDHFCDKRCCILTTKKRGPCFTRSTLSWSDDDDDEDDEDDNDYFDEGDDDNDDYDNDEDDGDNDEDDECSLMLTHCSRAGVAGLQRARVQL